MKKKMLVPAALLAALAFTDVVSAQTAAAQPTEDVAKLVELARKDFQKLKADIVAKTMEMDATTAAACWPVYKQFEAESVKLGDEKLAIVKDYAAAWNSKSLTDATAKDLLTRSLALEDKARALDKKTIDAMSKVLPAKTVARYFQVQNRLNALANLSLASEIPLIY
jgi:hypothetical protein